MYPLTSREMSDLIMRIADLRFSKQKLEENTACKPGMRSHGRSQEAANRGLYQPAPSDENVSLCAPGHAGISVFLCFINPSTMCDLYRTKSTLVESLNSGCSYVDKVVQEPVLSGSFPSHQAETQCLLATTPYSVPALLSGPGNH